MSIISQFFQTAIKIPILPSKPLVFSSPSSILSFSRTRAKREFKLHADINGEAPEVVVEPLATVDVLKNKFFELVNGSDRGLNTRGQTRAMIEEIINQLEAKTPYFALSDALRLLHGKWIVVYTSLFGIFPLLSSATLPLIKVGEISETVNSENLTLVNSLQLTSPLNTTSVTINSKFEIRSPKSVQVKFEEGIIRTVTNLPPLKLNINELVKLWIVETYIDEELRVSRTDVGIVIVFIKEGSPLLSSSLNS